MPDGTTEYMGEETFEVKFGRSSHHIEIEPMVHGEPSALALVRGIRIHPSPSVSLYRNAVGSCWSDRKHFCYSSSDCDRGDFCEESSTLGHFTITVLDSSGRLYHKLVRRSALNVDWTSRYSRSNNNKATDKASTSKSGGTNNGMSAGVDDDDNRDYGDIEAGVISADGSTGPPPAFNPLPRGVTGKTSAPPSQAYEEAKAMYAKQGHKMTHRIVSAGEFIPNPFNETIEDIAFDCPENDDLFHRFVCEYVPIIWTSISKDRRSAVIWR